jgi:hypothetical protein
MLLAVAVASVALAGHRWRTLSAIDSEWAAFHARKASAVESHAAMFEAYASNVGDGLMDSALIEDCGAYIATGSHIVAGRDTIGIPIASYRAELRRWIRYHQRLAGQYRRAAAYPWITLPPDPPKPPRFFYCSQPGVKDPGPIEARTARR